MVEPQHPAPAHPLVRSDQVEGTGVHTIDGKRIGTIRHLVIDKASGQVVYAVTAFGGFLGIGEEVHTIPWEKLNYAERLHGYSTDITEQQLNDAPEYSRNSTLLSGSDREELASYYMLE